MTAETKECLVCHEKIHPLARICTHCDSPQNWRRHLSISSNVLSLLIALFAVLGTTVPIIKKAFEGREVKVSASLIHRETKPVSAQGDPQSSGQKDFFNIAISNDGNAPAIVSAVRISWGNGGSRTRLTANLPSAFMQRHDYRVSPNNSVVLPFYVEPNQVPSSGFDIELEYVAPNHERKTYVLKSP